MSSFSWWVLLARRWGFLYNKNRKVMIDEKGLSNWRFRFYIFFLIIMVRKLVLIRHGESTWNHELRFTGRTDVDLTEKGITEAQKAAKLLKEENIQAKRAFTSYLKRAVKTLDTVLDGMDLDWIPVEKSRRLNEKHYGALQGLNKAETVQKYGEDQVLLWRRSYDVQSPALDASDERAPHNDPRYAEVDSELLPLTESLEDCVNRALPYLQEAILPAVEKDEVVLVSAHGNSLRGIIKVLKGMSNEEIIKLNLPNGMPYVFEFDDNMQVVKDYFLGDPEEVKKMMDAVANQGKK